MNASQTMRPAGIEDVALLLDMMSEFYAESGHPFDRENAAEAFTQLLADDSLGTVLLLQDSARVAGYAVLTCGFSMEYGGRDAFLDDLFVRPEFRRRGLGRSAIDALLVECRKRGVRAVHLEVARDNISAGMLYESLGFRGNDRRLLTLRLREGSDTPAEAVDGGGAR